MNEKEGSLHNIYYCRYYFSSATSFDDGVKALIEASDSGATPLRLVFFGTTESNETYKQELSKIRQRIKERFSLLPPVVSYVIQPLVEGGTMAVEAHYIKEECGVDLSCRTHGNTPYLLATVDGCRMLMLGGIMGGDQTSSTEQQSTEAFSIIEKIMTIEGFPVNSIVRQWNYIEQITRQENGVQRYQAFNDARTIFYRKADWQISGYPAATGIGTEWGGVMIDLIAALPADGARLNIVPLNNPLQVAAHDYSQQVLLGDKSARIESRSTPKFERGKVIATQGSFNLCFISGTAAIRGEQSIEQMNIEEQTKVTMENINHLISPENLSNNFLQSPKCFSPNTLRVYLKSEDSFSKVSSVLKKMCEGEETIFLLADICRDELLIEIEGIAT